MKHKTLLAVLAVVLVVLSSSSAFAAGVKRGWMALNGISAEGAQVLKKQGTSIWDWKVYRPEHGADDTIQFYETLNALVMALNSGEIDEFEIPQIAAEYLVNVNPDFMISCVARSHGAYAAFGFKEGEGESLQKRFNDTIIAMKKDGTLEELRQKYCTKPGKTELQAVTFDKFPDAETIKVAVTGDFPPIDFITPADEPTGLSMAVLAEVARRQKFNVEIMSVDSGARTSAIASGRADVVSWYEQIRDTKSQYDSARGVLYSEPYFEWDIFLHVKKK